MRVVGLLLVMSTIACDDEADGAQRVFTTSQIYTGVLGGIAGADAKCMQSAQSAGLAGTFIALISDATTTAISRVPSGGPWKLTNGQLVFADAANLATVPVAVLGVDEEGGTLTAGCAWTGSKAGGTSAPEHCANWTAGDNGSVGKTGNTNLNDNRWIEGISDCGNKPCNTSQHLYCLQL